MKGPWGTTAELAPDCRRSLLITLGSSFATHKNKGVAGLSKLKLLVGLDPIETDTARFWENHGEFNNVDSASIRTEVFMLPVTSFAEEEGHSPTPAGP